MNKKIAIFCLHYGGLTGSELYFYELSKLLKDSFDISIYSNIDYSFKDITLLDNVSYYDLKECHIVNSYDTVLLSHGPYMINNLKKYVNNYSNTPIINIIHSEVLPMEAPLDNDLITFYVGIRQSIVDYLICKEKITSSKVVLIHNPIDTERFNTLNLSLENNGIFIGTMNHLRIAPFIDFMNVCEKLNLNVQYIGDINDDIKDKFSNIEFINPIFNIEDFIKKAKLVGGILNGRSYWESKLCMKDTLEYIVDDFGNIIYKKLESVVDCDHVRSSHVKIKFISLIHSILDNLK